MLMDVELGEDRSFLSDLLAGKPEGTREKVRPGIWLVMGSKGTSYEVNLREMVCQCGHHRHRLVPGESCKHMRRLIEDLQDQGLDFCPGCRNAVEPLCRWCEGEVMIPMAECQAIRDYLEELRERGATKTGMSEEERRRIFA